MPLWVLVNCFVAGRRGISNKNHRTSCPPQPGGHLVTTPTTDVIKASCPGDVGLTDTLSLAEETPAGGRHTLCTCQLTLVLLCTYLPPTCRYSRAWKNLTTSPASTSPRSPCALVPINVELF
ncbi:hypothetical protein Pmani_006727 [Petrolisthes manimaculis]|uniref:Uncharacterized protein n=1 Tax=Petrolisthes manimaculis TaxID=1843537 RepID=A0AAE1UFH4_9EUCA|nr:hypothetical protein Pmani_033543 [Petrolisthes manimaculis]KAK4322548.1 hypothetical protein Pmani_006727 [Petrolisthes manimaculis]